MPAQYRLKIKSEDRDVLALTNDSAFTQWLTDDEAAIYSTFDHAVFKQWCAELEVAGRAYELL